MSTPAPQEPRHGGGRWETIRYALESNARTFRLCLILLVTIVAPVAAAVIAELIRHMLLCASGGPRLSVSDGGRAGAVTCAFRSAGCPYRR